MNEFSIRNIKYEYNNFKERMISTIKNPQIYNNISPFEECYLIEETYINEFEYNQKLLMILILLSII